MLTKTKQPQNVLGNYHKSFCGLYVVWWNKWFCVEIENKKALIPKRNQSLRIQRCVRDSNP